MVYNKVLLKFCELSVGGMFCLPPDGHRTPRKTELTESGCNWYMADTGESGYIEPDKVVEFINWGANKT